MPRIIRAATPAPVEAPQVEDGAPVEAPALPTVAQLEADALAGVPVSLSDLAGAIGREGRTWEKKATAGKRRKAAPQVEALADVEAPQLETEAAPVEAPAVQVEAPAAPVAVLVPARDLVIAEADGPDADLYEAPRDTAEEAAALRESIAAGGIAQPVQAVRRSGPDRLVVLNGRRRVAAARALDALALVPVVVRPDVSGIRAELAAAELNETGVASNPALLVDRLARARAAGVEDGALIRAAGRASRARSLLVFADRAGPDLRGWLSSGVLSESTACLVAEATDSADVQAAALALLQAEVDAARASPDGKAAGLTGSRKGDATIDSEGRAHVTRAAASVAVSKALAAAGVQSRRTAPAPAPVLPPAPVAQVEAGPALDDSTAAPAQVEAPASDWSQAGVSLETFDQGDDSTTEAPDGAAHPAPAAPLPVMVAQLETEAPAETDDRPAPIVVPAWATTPPPAPVAPAPSTSGQAPRPAPRTKPGALSGSVTSAAAAALSRAYGVAPSTLTGDGRAFLAGVRAALDYLTNGARPTGDTGRRFGATFDVVFPA